MTARRWPVLLASAVAALALCGCGGGSTAAPAAGATSGAATSAAAAQGGDVQSFCAAIKAQAALLQGTELSSLLTGGTPSAWKAYFDKVGAMNQQLVDAAPADIQPTVKTLQATSTTMRDTLAAANYDVAKVGSAQMLKAIQSKDRIAASQTLTTYVQKNCGVDLTKPAA